MTTPTPLPERVAAKSRTYSAPPKPSAALAAEYEPVLGAQACPLAGRRAPP